MGERLALVVDDSKSARFALRKYLESHAFRVDTADSARAAYAWLQTQRPDLIFLDHVMPGEDGFTALQHIKQDPQTADIPVVICSSNEGSAFVAEARSRGAADVLAKPPTPEQLRRVLQQLGTQAPPLPRPAVDAATPSASTPVPAAVPQAATPGRVPTPAAEPAIDGATDTARLDELRAELDLLRAELSSSSGDAAQATEALQARASAIEARLSAIEQRLASDLASSRKHLDKEIEALRRHGEQALAALRAQHESALEALRAEQQRTLDELAQRHAQERDSQRRQFDIELRVIHKQLRAELERAIHTAREQTLQELRARLLAALNK
ncbi:response regulator [Sinimarinibacterium thermocellulolyticum]